MSPVTLSGQATLPFPHGHDLPPRWDGHPITWSGWQEPLTTTWDLHHTAQDSCESCGHHGNPPSNLGTIHRTLTALDGRATRHTTITATLCAYRCPACHLDTVVDLTTSEAWILDESDYHDEGSHA